MGADPQLTAMTESAFIATVALERIHRTINVARHSAAGFDSAAASSSNV
jgi:hypothetical protein